MKKFVVGILGLFLAIACSSSDNETDPSTKEFDRTSLLTNWADNIIIPSHENYLAKTTALETATVAFTTTPTEANLVALRTVWIEAYKAFQYVALYNFGKATDIYFNEFSNTYPTDVTSIETNITSGTYNLELYSQYSKQGLPALDYLLNGLGTDDATILSFYTTNANAENYKTYLNKVASRLKQTSTIVTNDWKKSYREIYVKNNGTSVASSVSITTNAFVKNFEKDVRTGKIGIPAGKFSSGTTFTDKVEAYYKNDISSLLLQTANQASQDFFNGKYFGSDKTGSSLKSFLDYVDASRDGAKLSTTINKQYTSITTTNGTVNASYSKQIKEDNNKILTLYDVMQKNVIYLKLDMMQALNITIDYVDGDGD